MRQSNVVARGKLPRLATGPFRDNPPSNIQLSHFTSMFHFYTPLRTFEGTEVEHWAKMGQ